MPLFEYRVLTPEGKKRKGVIDADALSFAKEKLQREGLLLVALHLQKEKRREIVLPSALRLSFTRELYQLLRAGLPLYESLLTIEEKYRKNRSHSFFLDACDSLRSGKSLSEILSRYRKSFDGIYCSMVTAAERTGALAAVFGQLMELLSNQQKIKKQLIGALTYPLLLAVFCLFLVLSLLLFVIPSLSELFEGRRLHPFTESVLALSRLTRAYGFLFLLTLLTSSGTLLFFIKKRDLSLSSLFFRLPLLRTLGIQFTLVRFSRAASLLLEGGVPLLQMLKLSKGVASWPPFQTLIDEASAKVQEGEVLSVQLAKASWIPSLVPRMVALAEETGRLKEMLKSVALIYEEELDKSLSQLTALLQPALLLFLGVVVGVVLVSILLPLTDVSSFLST